MRVSTDPKDPSYIDGRPRRVWCNDQLVEGWTVADEFRRVVITPDKVLHGAILVERLSDDQSAPAPAISPQAPVNTGFSGMFVHTSDKPTTHPRKKRR